MQCTKGHNSVKTVDGVIVLNLCTFSGEALYLYRFKTISHRVSELLSGCDLYNKICKGALFCKIVDGVIVFVLFTLSDIVLC